jgi:hypothetical protein
MDRVPEIGGGVMSLSLRSHYRLTGDNVGSGLHNPDLHISQNQGEGSLIAALQLHGAAPN